MHPAADFPDAWTGGRLRGRSQVAAHWAQQWRDTRSTLRPLAAARDPADRLAVTVHQVVRDADGDLLSEATVLHVLSLRTGLVARLDVGEPPP